MACERSAAEGGAVQARRIHRSLRMGGGADLQLEATETTGADDPATNASAQRHRGVEHHEKDGLAAMPPTRPLISRSSRLVAREPLLRHSRHLNP